MGGLGDISGVDTEGRQFASVAELWEHELKDRDEQAASQPKSSAGTGKKWYSNALTYWTSVEPSKYGVMGGQERVHEIDIRDSREFLKQVMGDVLAESNEDTLLRAADCGAGIGRVTKSLLMDHFNEVDLIEPAPHFLQKAEEELKGRPNSLKRHRCQYVCQSLENFEPQPKSYDCIWIQWCAGHLTDEDFLSFLRRCTAALRDNGVIVLKENNSQSGFVVDREDSSLTRSDQYFRRLFESSDLSILKTMKQRNFPEELFSVRMYGLVAKENIKAKSQRLERRKASEAANPRKSERLAQKG